MEVVICMTPSATWPWVGPVEKPLPFPPPPPVWLCDVDVKLQEVSPSFFAADSTASFESAATTARTLARHAAAEKRISLFMGNDGFRISGILLPLGPVERIFFAFPHGVETRANLIRSLRPDPIQCL